MTKPASVPTLGSAAPTLEYEHSLLRRGHRYVIGMDEVGRGALAGPVSVGALAIGQKTLPAPPNLRDSKLISATLRTSLIPQINEWCVTATVGHSSPQEIDELGIIGALRLAGRRAITQLAAEIVADAIVLLDGSHDWLAEPELDLFSTQDNQHTQHTPLPSIVTRVKADLYCASVAGASVLAKCDRDAKMTALNDEFPAYGWAGNKGYASAQHMAALREAGPSPWHRVSWKLPT